MQCASAGLAFVNRRQLRLTTNMIGLFLFLPIGV